jgi:hypothetical protein
VHDPWLSYYGHPFLPAGFNADDTNGDEINGAGTNWPVWPYLFDSFVPLEVLIVTPEMMEIFDGCADYVVPLVARDIPISPEPNVYALAAQSSEVKVAGVQTELVIGAVNNVIVFPAVEYTLVIPGASMQKSA